MNNFRIAVKGFVVDENCNLLLLKRGIDRPHKPGVWDIPGGRLDEGENPFLGLQREIKEETNLEIEIGSPIDVHHFVRDDGQQITMLIFKCSPKHKSVMLSHEHEAYDWVHLSKAKEKICPTFHPLMDKFFEDYGHSIIDR